MKEILTMLYQKLTSRKFLLALALVIAGLMGVSGKVDVSDTVEQIVRTQPDSLIAQVMVYLEYVPRVIGAVMAILGALGFIKAEAKVDATRQR